MPWNPNPPAPPWSTSYPWRQAKPKPTPRSPSKYYPPVRGTGGWVPTPPTNIPRDPNKYYPPVHGAGQWQNVPPTNIPRDPNKYYPPVHGAGQWQNVPPTNIPNKSAPAKTYPPVSRYGSPQTWKDVPPASPAVPMVPQEKPAMQYPWKPGNSPWQVVQTEPVAPPTPKASGHANVSPEFHAVETPAEIRAKQAYLAHLGFNINADGVRGPITESAIAWFKAHHSAEGWVPPQAHTAATTGVTTPSPTYLPPHRGVPPVNPPAVTTPQRTPSAAAPASPDPATDPYDAIVAAILQQQANASNAGIDMPQFTMPNIPDQGQSPDLMAILKGIGANQPPMRSPQVSMPGQGNVPPWPNMPKAPSFPDVGPLANSIPDPYKYAQNSSNAQYDAQIAALQRAEDDAASRGKDNLANIQKWYGSAKDSFNTGLNAEHAGYDQSLSGMDSATQNFISAIGGKANEGSSSVAAAGVNNRGELAAQQQSTDSFMNEMQSIIDMGGAEALTGEQKRSSGLIDDLAAQIHDQLKEKGSAYATTLADSLNNRFGQMLDLYNAQSGAKQQQFSDQMDISNAYSNQRGQALSERAQLANERAQLVSENQFEEGRSDTQQSNKVTQALNIYNALSGSSQQKFSNAMALANLKSTSDQQAFTNALNLKNSKFQQTQSLFNDTMAASLRGPQKDAAALNAAATKASINATNTGTAVAKANAVLNAGEFQLRVKQANANIGAQLAASIRADKTLVLQGKLQADKLDKSIHLSDPAQVSAVSKSLRTLISGPGGRLIIDPGTGWRSMTRLLHQYNIDTPQGLSLAKSIMADVIDRSHAAKQWTHYVIGKDGLPHKVK